jgi:hypothetical protein
MRTRSTPESSKPFESPTEAHGAAYFLVVTDTGVDHWGRYRDTYVGDRNAWHIAHRSVRTDGRVPGGFADHRQL